MMEATKCPKCASPVRKSYVCDNKGEVIGQNLFCVFCTWKSVGGW